MTVAILGGGIAGLSTGYFLKKGGFESFDLIEATDDTGGLCRSICLNECFFDISGSHVIHSKDSEILDFMLSLLDNKYVKRERVAKIYFKGRWVSFPFSSNLMDFSFAERAMLYYDYLKSRILGKLNGCEIRNYHEWSVRNFGEMASRIHYLPYATKIYKSSLENIGYKWIKDIVPPPRYTRLRSILNPKNHYKSYFYYPLDGGIQTLIEPMANAIKGHIQLNTPVTEMYKVKNGFIVNGTFYNKVISTIPLPDLRFIISDLPEMLTNMLGELKYLSLYTQLIGTKSKMPIPSSWFYIPGEETPFNRVSYLNNLIDDTTADKLSSVLAEMTVRNDDMSLYSEDYFESALKTLEKIGLLKATDVVFRETRFTKYAYVLGDHYYEKNIDEIRNMLSEYGLVLNGRFGEFKYINMDGIVRNSLRIAREIIQLK